MALDTSGQRVNRIPGQKRWMGGLSRWPRAPGLQNVGSTVCLEVTPADDRLEELSCSSRKLTPTSVQPLVLDDVVSLCWTLGAAAACEDLLTDQVVMPTRAGLGGGLVVPLGLRVGLVTAERAGAGRITHGPGSPIRSVADDRSRPMSRR